MDNLDQYAGSYVDQALFSLDNSILLNFYPKRITSAENPNNSVLELGVGHGFTVNIFENYFNEYSVIDGSEKVIEQYKNNHPGSKAEMILSYFENFETKKQFDIVIMGFILEHVDDPLVILKKYKEIMRPGGRCYVAVPNAESLHRRVGHCAGLLDDMTSLGDGDLAFGHKRLYTVNSLSEQLHACGYEIIRKEGLFLKPFTTAQIQSLVLAPGIYAAMCEVGVNYPELCTALLFEARKPL